MTDEPTLRYHSHLEYMVYIIVNSWYCAFCGFGHMCNDLYPSLWYHTLCFHCPKNFMLCLFSSLTLQPPLTLQPLPITDLFIVLLVLPLSECPIVGITVCNLFRLAFLVMWSAVIGGKFRIPSKIISLCYEFLWLLWLFPVSGKPYNSVGVFSDAFLSV